MPINTNKEIAAASGIAANVWAQARTLADVGRLTAHWLEGSIGEHPGYPGGPPDEETLPLVPSLVAANHVGWVTIMSQPGCAETAAGERSEQRATVEALVADEELLLRMALEAWRRGIHVVAHQGPGRDLGWAFPVTVVDGEPFTWAGHRIAYDDLVLMFEGCHRDAIKAAVNAWQVTLIDPVVGRNTVLWHVLDAVTGRTPAEAAPNP